MKKKVFLVTGGTGFIGSNISKFLLEKGYKIKIFDNNYRGGFSKIKKIKKKLKFIKGDIRDSDLIRRSIKGSDIVFHLASLIAIPYSYDAPRSYVDTNVTGALNVLEACKDLDSLERILHASTSETYGYLRRRNDMSEK